MPDSPVQLLARKQIFRNSVFTVYSDHIRDAAGNEVTDYLSVVPHHRAAHGITGIAVLPVVNGEFGLLRVHRHPLGEAVWEAVRGFVDEKEAPAAAALRELREEAGLLAVPGSLRELGTLAPEPGVIQARVGLFVAEGCNPASVAPDREMGHGELKYFSRSAVIEMFGSGQIMDPCTLACCYRYWSTLP
jgi:8-oxo-dGTP pyrophosphatase MutT (NUDIX family)